MALKNVSNQTLRRLIIGGNVVLSIAVVWAIILMVNFMLSRMSPMPVDTTRAGQFSISSRTINLLRELDDEIILTALYRAGDSDDSDQTEIDRRQRRQVEDLMRRYSDLSSRVSYQMLDPIRDTAAKTALINRLIERYSGEADQHKRVIGDFVSLSPRVVALLESERETLQNLIRSTPNLNTHKSVVAIYYQLGVNFNNVRKTIGNVEELVSGEDVPRYGDAVRLIQGAYQSVQEDLRVTADYLSTEGLKIENLPNEVRTFFAESSDRYHPIVEDLEPMLAAMTNLPRLDLDYIYDQVRQRHAKIILVESAHSPHVRILNFDDVWKTGAGRSGGAGQTQYEFNGEAAVSSAILALTVEEKSAVIFVHAGPPSPIRQSFDVGRVSQPLFGAVAEKLEQANFIVDTWDVLAKPDAPSIPQAGSRLFVVLPYASPPQQPGMASSGGYQPEHVTKIEQLIDQGERMMFLVNFSPGFIARPYPFRDLLATKYGIRPDADKLVLQGFQHRGQTFPISGIEVTQYNDFEITRPIQSLNTAFDLAVPILLKDDLPEHVTINPLVTITPDSGDFWAESNIIMLMQNQWAEKDSLDLLPPFYLAVAAENSETGGKVVVVANEMFATDAMVNNMQAVLTAQGIGAILVNPGNAELFTNSAFWLNDNENMIAVGPRGADIARITHIPPGRVKAWQVFLWVIWPMGALCTGGAMYLFRRK